MKQVRRYAALFAVMLLLVMSFGTAVHAADVKVPKPTAEFYCNDFAKILDARTEEEIVSRGESIYKSTDGGQVVFVSVDTLDNSTIEEYANTLYNKWKIGKDDRGVLFILSMQERRARIEVGYGYEGVLTDIESNDLLAKFAELNKQVGIDEAVRTIYADIGSIISGNGDEVIYPRTDEGRQQGSNQTSFIAEHPILSAILAIIVLIMIVMDFALTGGRVTFFILRMMAASARRGGGGGGGRNSGGGGRSGGGGSSSGF